jgi:hypothetical protein
MLAPNALTTLATVKPYLQMDVIDTSNDATLSMIINSASAFIETQTGRTFGKASYTDKNFAPVPATVILKNTPVQSVDSIKVGGFEIDESTYYETDLYLGTVLNPFGWAIDMNGVVTPKLEITYTAGYTLPKDDTPEHPRTLPYDLETLCIELVAKAWNRVQTQADGKKSETQGSWSISYNDELTEQQRLTLNKYTRLV